MNFKLIPICSEIEHEMEYKYKEGHQCDICHKKYISYRCINCEYGRCSKCHRDILASEEISERLRKEKIKNSIKLAESKLKEDGLTQWTVMVSNGEICYINKLMRTYSFDYPYTPPPPEDSPIYIDISPKDNCIPDEDNCISGEAKYIPTEYINQAHHIRCNLTNIYEYLKNLIS